MSLPSGYALDQAVSQGGSNLPSGYQLDQQSNQPASSKAGYQTGLQKSADAISGVMQGIDNFGKPQVPYNEPGPQGDNLFNRMGTALTEKLASRDNSNLQLPIKPNEGHPYLNAGAGTVVSMANPQNWITPAGLPEKVQLPGAGMAKDVAQNAARRTLGYTKGMLKKPGALERANQVGQTMLDQNVIRNPLTSPLSFGAEDTYGRASDLADTSGQALGKTIIDLSESGKPSIDTNAIGEEISNQLKPKFKGGAYDAEHNTLGEILDTIGAHGNGPIDFVSAQALKEKLGELASFSKNTDALKSNMYRRAYGIISDAIDKTVSDATNGTTTATQYAENKSIYGASKEAEKALLNRISSEAGNRRVGLTDTIMAGGELAAGHPGAAAALVGLKHGVETAGNALTARIADYLAKSGTVSKPGIQAAIAALLAAKTQGRQQ